MLAVGVHYLSCDGSWGLDINAEAIQGDILSQADALPDCTKLIQLCQVTVGFSGSRISLLVGHHLRLEIMPVGGDEAPESLCVWHI